MECDDASAVPVFRDPASCRSPRAWAVRRTATRIACVAITITTKTPVAAKKPSVSAVRSDFAGDDHADYRREAIDRAARCG